MSCYSKTIESLFEYRELSGAVDQKRLPMGVLGLSHIHKAHFIHALCEEKKKKALVIVPDEANATRLQGDLSAMGTAAFVLPAADLSFRPTQAHSREYEQQRLGVLSAMLEGEPDAVILSAEAALQFTMPPQVLRRNTMVIGQDSEIVTDMIAEDLIAAGYVRSDLVEGKGQFSVRGGLIDIFPPSSPNPVRIELWGEAVDNIAFFDPETQRRTEQIGEIRITPATNVLFEDAETLIALIQKQIASVKSKNAAKVKAQLEEDIEKLKSEGLLSETAGKKRSLVVNTGIIAKPGDETEHHLHLITADGGNLFLSFVMREDQPEFNGPFCASGLRGAGDIIACCAMTEEAYASVMERYWK